MKCRICDSDLNSSTAVSLKVPRGTQLFLDTYQIESDSMISIDLVSCDYCGHLQTLQSPIIYEKQLSSASYVSDQLLQHRVEQAQKTFTYAAKTPCKILEVGCGDGHFLERLAGMTSSVVGVEPSRKSARLARERGLMIEEILLDEE